MTLERPESQRTSFQIQRRKQRGGTRNDRPERCFYDEVQTKASATSGLNNKDFSVFLGHSTHLNLFDNRKFVGQRTKKS